MNRIVYLDKIKGISIFLVVFCHYVLLPSTSLLGNLVMLIAWGAVPCFFLTSGAIMHSMSEFQWKKYLFRLLKTYVVLCVWRVFYLLISLAYLEVAFSKAQLFIYIFMFGSIENVKSDVLWFMNAYLCTMLFLPISYFLFQEYERCKKVILFLLLLLLASGIIINTGNLVSEAISSVTGMTQINLFSWQQIVPFGNYKNMMLYFVLGGLVYKESGRIRVFVSKNRLTYSVPILMFVMGIIGLLLIKYYQTGSFRWENTYLGSGYEWCSTVLLSLGIYCMVLCYSKNTKDSLFACIGRTTMGIYYLHYPLLGYLSQTDLWRELGKYNSVVLNTLKAIVVVGICFVVTKLLKRVWGIRYLFQ